MSRGVNKAIIVGNIGSDPEVRYSASGSAMATLSIATSEQWKDKVTGEKKEKTEWHRVKFFGRLAEIVGEYLTKGKQVYIEGRLETDKYTDKEGVERYSTSIIANEMQMLGGTGDGGQRDRPASDRASGQRGGAQAPAQTRDRPPAPTGDRDYINDAIPF